MHGLMYVSWNVGILLGEFSEEYILIEMKIFIKNLKKKKKSLNFTSKRVFHLRRERPFIKSHAIHAICLPFSSSALARGNSHFRYHGDASLVTVQMQISRRITKTNILRSLKNEERVRYIDNKSREI